MKHKLVNVSAKNQDIKRKKALVTKKKAEKDILRKE